MTSNNAIRIKCSKCGAIAKGTLMHLKHDVKCQNCHEICVFHEVIKCPYCAEDIQAKARKCKHCGEWIDGKEHSPPNAVHSSDLKDFSAFALYHCVLVDSENRRHKEVDLCAQDNSQLAKLIENKYGFEFRLDQKSSPLKWEIGKFSCPKCGFKYTVCDRHIGIAILIIIFVSFGLGLIMVPFLPHDCTCKACGHRWKS